MNNEKAHTTKLKPVENLQKGECVIMHTCLEARNYKGRVWIVKESSFINPGGVEVVYLEGLPGDFKTEYLKRVEP